MSGLLLLCVGQYPMSDGHNVNNSKLTSLSKVRASAMATRRLAFSLFRSTSISVSRLVCDHCDRIDADGFAGQQKIKSPEQPGLSIHSAGETGRRAISGVTRDAIAPGAGGNSPSRGADGDSPSTDDGSTRGRNSRVASMERLHTPRPQPAHMPPSTRSPNIRSAIRSGIAARRRWGLRESQPRRAVLLPPGAEPQPQEAALPGPGAEPQLRAEAGALYKGRPPRLRPGRRRPR
jgi:hypothetical protein